MNGRLRLLLCELRRSERGIALPMVLVITVVCMGFAAVPVVASINAQNGDSHNQGTNEALAAAEAGAEIALLKQSKMLTEATNGNHPDCVGEEVSVIADGSGEEGWCPKVPATEDVRAWPKVGEARYAYQVKPCYAAAGACDDLAAAETESCPETGGDHLLVEIVSTGYTEVAGQPIYRRIAVTGCADAIVSQSLQNEITLTRSELETKEGEVADKQHEIDEVKGEIKEEKDAQSAEVKKKEEELNPGIEALEAEKSKYLEELEVDVREERTLREEVKQLEGEPGGTEYTETPGETYYETTKTPPPNVWGAGQIVGIEGLTMGNNAQIYNGGAASNKAVSMVGSANVCGTVRYGTTFTTDNSTSAKAPSSCAAGRTVTQGTATYPAVTLPSNIATENSDSRLCTEAACHKGEDPVPSSVWERGNMSYNASNKSLSVNYSSLTLEGTKPYYLCQLILAGGSSLYAGSGKSITIYFAPPSQCGGLNGGAQLQIANGTYVYADASSGPKFLFVGSSSKPSESRIEFAGGAKSEQFVVYAPYSQIIANNGIEMSGAIIGNTLELQGGASINKYGTFTPPAAETFLPSTETKVEKHKEATKTAHPSERLVELKEELETWEEKTVEKQNEIAEVTRQIEELEKIKEREVTAVAELREGEIKELEGTRSSLEDEKSELVKTKNEVKEHLEELEGKGKDSVKALKKQSFRECSGEPVFGGAPDEGC